MYKLNLKLKLQVSFYFYFHILFDKMKVSCTVENIQILYKIYKNHLCQIKYGNVFFKILKTCKRVILA